MVDRGDTTGGAYTRGTAEDTQSGDAQTDVNADGTQTGGVTGGAGAGAGASTVCTGTKRAGINAGTGMYTFRSGSAGGCSCASTRRPLSFVS